MPDPDLERELKELHLELQLAVTRSEVDQLIDRHIEVFRKLRAPARTWLLTEVIGRKLANLPD
jgi:hypothetical protein